MADVSTLYQGIGIENPGGVVEYSRSRPSVSWGSDKYAQENRAWLAREHWADYKNRFMPYEDELVDAVTGTELLDERLGKITINNNNAFNVAAADADRYRARYGVQQSEAQKTQDQNNRQLAQAQANASARNQTRTHVYDRNMAAIGGGQVRQAATGS